MKEIFSLASSLEPYLILRFSDWEGNKRMFWSHNTSIPSPHPGICSSKNRGSKITGGIGFLKKKKINLFKDPSRTNPLTGMTPPAAFIAVCHVHWVCMPKDCHYLKLDKKILTPRIFILQK